MVEEESNDDVRKQCEGKQECDVDVCAIVRDNIERRKRKKKQELIDIADLKVRIEFEYVLESHYSLFTIFVLHSCKVVLVPVEGERKRKEQHIKKNVEVDC